MKPVKKRWSPDFISPTASSIGKVEPSLRSADHHAADADDAPLAGRADSATDSRRGPRDRATGISMLDVLPDHLVGRYSRTAAAPRTLNDWMMPRVVDDHHGVGHGVEDRLQMRFARQQRLRAERVQRRWLC